MAGVAPDPADCTLTVIDALLAPLYVAVMVPVPKGKFEPFNASVAVAVPADPVKTADPNGLPSKENETEPAGVMPLVSSIGAGSDFC